MTGIWAAGAAGAPAAPGPGPSPEAADGAAGAEAEAGAEADAEALAAGDAELTGDIVFSVPSGTFRGEVSVGLSTAVSGAQIRYTTDGTLPTAGSPLYGGTPLRFTTTTQLRAQAFVNGTPSGDPGTAMYIAHNVSTSHDLPLLVMDAYGGGKPDREYADVATMVMEPQPAGGTTSLSAAPALATRAGFHLRGQSSSTFEKAPYRLELRDNEDDDLDLPVLGMPAEADWVLRGPFSDKTLIHDAFVYDLGRAMGMQAPRYAFVELYLNLDGQPMGTDDYQGVYMLVETIKNQKNRLDLKSLDEDDTTLPAISGGYIFKFEWMAAEEPILDCPGGTADCWQYLEVHDPDELNTQQRTWLAQHLREFHTALRGSRPSDPQTGYPAYIDVQSFADQIIINELSREMDSYIRSQYFYKDREGKIFAGPLWDYDLAFGVGGFFNNQQTQGWQYEQTRQPAAHDWFTRLTADPAFDRTLRARWQELRQGVLSDQQLGARIDALTRPLVNAAQRNFQKWPNLTSPTVGFFMTPTASTWQGQIQHMRNWLTERTAWLDSAWQGGTTTGGTTDGGTSNGGTTNGGTTNGGSTTGGTSTGGSTTGGTGNGCSAAYRNANEWPGGFTGEVVISCSGGSLGGWTVSWTWPGSQQLTQSWNATCSQSGTTVTCTNAQWNGNVTDGGQVSFGFNGTFSGSNPAPTAITVR
ncbi:CotH kinase family protein [Streptomyces aidingensis]|nr:CotH kinase family protein [Streptomyces aidingensis]